MTDTTTTTPDYDADLIRWMGLCYLVSQRDKISMDKASERLAALMDSPEVQAQHAAEVANSAEVKLEATKDALTGLAQAIEDLLQGIQSNAIDPT